MDPGGALVVVVVVGGHCNNDDVFQAHGSLAVLDRFAKGGNQGDDR